MLQPYSKILVVDDSAVARKCIRRLLNDIGFHFVREAVDGTDAIAKLTAQPFDLVISDWDMSGMDGLALLRWMRDRREFHKMPFIMVTALSARKYQDVARDNGATFFLSKPMARTDLASRIASLGAARIAA